MIIIDLTIPLKHQMRVYPGDPEIIIESALTFEKDGWNVQRIQLNSHLGTHVNVPFHATKNGKKLGDYALPDFVGQAVIYEQLSDIKSDKGVIFRDCNVDRAITERIKAIKPPFIGISAAFDFDEALEIELLEAEIISFENLINLDQLPKEFMFFGIPLHIEDGDGSTVRAFAIDNSGL
jgi:arylformamidase